MQILKIEVTPAMVERTRKDWEVIAAQPVDVEYVKGTFYGFCSELGAYRLERKYNCRPRGEAGWSPARKSWYFRLETNL